MANITNTARTQSSIISNVSDADLAAFILRATMGILFIIHGGLKLFVFTPAGTAQFFESIGFPGFLAYPVIAIEILGGIALLLGVWTRSISLALAVVLLGTIYAPHGAAGFFFSNPGGGWEYPAFWAITLVALALLGNGAFAVQRNRA